MDLVLLSSRDKVDDAVVLVAILEETRVISESRDSAGLKESWGNLSCSESLFFNEHPESGVLESLGI